MPRISEFYGIVIGMFWDEHPPPHFHAVYGDYRAKIAIATGRVSAGELPTRALRFVQEWVELHRDELMANWRQVREAVASR